MDRPTTRRSLSHVERVTDGLDFEDMTAVDPSQRVIHEIRVLDPARRPRVLPAAAQDESRPATSLPPAKKRVRPPCVGDVLDGVWRLEAVLGAGGSAYVYAASHQDGRRVAVKVLREELASEPMIVARFVGDGRIASLVRHPGVVVPLHEGVSDGGLPYLVVELLDGQTLEERLDSRGPLSLREACAMTRALLDVLVATHTRAIIHRDVKPDNVFLTRHGRLKLIDFGIARPPSDLEAERTMEHSVLGTPMFMSPEQVRGRWDEIDHRADLWAVGATFFRAVTGRNVRNGETLMMALLEASQPVEPMIKLAPELPAAIRAWLDRALAFERTDRFASATEMIEALQHALGPMGSGMQPSRASSPALAEDPSSACSPYALGRRPSPYPGQLYSPLPSPVLPSAPPSPPQPASLLPSGSRRPPSGLAVASGAVAAGVATCLALGIAAALLVALLKPGFTLPFGAPSTASAEQPAHARPAHPAADTP